MSSDETTDEKSSGSTTQSSDTTSGKSKKRRILLVPYPKFVFMYPTLIMAIVGSIVLWIGGHHVIDPAEHKTPVVITGLFLAVMMANMFIIVFDFPRATSLTLVFVITTLGMGLWMFGLAKPEALPSLEAFLMKIRPAANATFYHCITISMCIMYIAVFIKSKFDYWELTNNELLHHHGLLSDLKRYPAPNLRVDKEINDVFEFMLLGAGRLILHPSTEKRSIVLDNILFVGRREKELTKMLGSIKVKIGDDSGSL